MISDHKKGKYSAANLLGNKFMEFLVIENFCDVPFIIGVDCVYTLVCTVGHIWDKKDTVTL